MWKEAVVITHKLLFPEANIEFLEELFQDELDNMLEQSRIVTVKKDSRFITGNEELSKIWILLAGEVNVLEEYRTGLAYIFQKNESPSIFGEMELIADMDYFMASLIAKTECLLITIPVQKYLEYLKRHPQLLYQRAKENLKVLLLSSHDNRVYMQLQSIERIKVYFIKHFVVNGDDEICTLKITYQQIADETGYSLKTVFRCITKLKNQGFLIVSREKITISKEQYVNLLNSLEDRV